MDSGLTVTKGDFKEYSDTFILQSGQTQSVDIDTKGALEIAVQIKNTLGNNLEIGISPSLGLGFTTLPLKNLTLIKDENKIIKIETGYYKIKIDFLNNDLDNSTNINYICIVKK